MAKKNPRLIMASNHIGTRQDTPLRTIEAIKNSDLLVFESKEGARNLLKQAGLERPYEIYSEHREVGALTAIDKAFSAGLTVLYASDQGSPVLSDPGGGLLEKAYRDQCHISVIPGPSSLTGALSACPFKLDQFFFAGFPPRKKEERQIWLGKLEDKHRGEALILMDAPYRLGTLLSEAAQFLGPQRRGFLALDIGDEGVEEYHVAASLSQLSQKDWGKRNFILICSGY